MVHLQKSKYVGVHSKVYFCLCQGARCTVSLMNTNFKGPTKLVFIIKSSSHLDIILHMQYYSKPSIYTVYIYTVDSTYKEPCYKELLLIKNNLPSPSLSAYLFPLL